MGNGFLGDLGGLGLGLGTMYALSQLGRTPTPSVGETTGAAIEALTRPKGGYRDYAEMLREEALADLRAGQNLYPEQLKLAQSELAAAKAFVPQYGQLASDEAYREAMSEAGKQVDVLRGPGAQLISEARALSRQADPEFYGRRAQTGAMLGDLLGSFIDPSTREEFITDSTGKLVANPAYDPKRPGGYFTGALSGSERAEIDRSIAQNRARSGSTGGPTPMSDVVANAMMFGQGVQNRRDALGRALGQATSFLPASRSGFDPFQVAMGRPSQQFGAQQFAPPTAMSPTQGQAGQFMGNVFGAAQQSAGFKANQPSLLTNLGSVAQTFPGLAGGLSW
tara:strand:- start:967 stop:1977 length:1011 start_codon:yes stop_codon:yes gene_type:complete